MAGTLERVRTGYMTPEGKAAEKTAKSTQYSPAYSVKVSPIKDVKEEAKITSRQEQFNKALLTAKGRRGGASGWVGVSYDGAQVAVDDPRATSWFNTRTYDSLKCKPSADYLENSSKRVPKGEDLCGVGASRKKRKSKTRKSRKSRRVTRRKL